MAFKGRDQTRTRLDFKRLKSTLATSDLQAKDNSLFQVIDDLIEGSGDFKDQLLRAFDKDNDKLDLTKQVDRVLSPDNGGSYSSYYFPILTDVVNVTLSSEFYTMFFRAGKIIYVSGKAAITPTAGATLTEFEISLPIPSNFTASDQLNGTCVGHTDSGVPTSMANGIITGNVATQTANIKFFSLDTGIHDVRFIFAYELF